MSEIKRVGTHFQDACCTPGEGCECGSLLKIINIDSMMRDRVDYISSSSYLTYELIFPTVSTVR